MKFPKVQVNYGFVLLVCTMYLFDRENLLFLTLFAALIHELGHLFLCQICGVSVGKMIFGSFGVCIAFENPSTVPYWKEFLIAFGGPLIGIIVSWIAGANGYPLFSGLNLSLSLFNLMPILPLDGGRMLRSFLRYACSVRTADCISFGVGASIVILMMCICGILLAHGQCTFAFVFLCAFLACALLQPNED